MIDYHTVIAAVAVTSPANAPVPGVMPSPGTKKDIQNLYYLF
jgi:hypothetical protein